MPEMIGATARSPAQSTHFRFASACGVIVIRSGMSFLRSCRCWGTGFRVMFTQSPRIAPSFSASSAAFVRNASVCASRSLDDGSRLGPIVLDRGVPG